MKDKKTLWWEEKIAEIQEQLELLRPGSIEYKELLDTLKEHQELYLEYEDKKHGMKTRNRELGVKIAGTVGSLAFNWIWLSKGMRFEETGVFSSTTFRNFFNGLGRKTH